MDDGGMPKDWTPQPPPKHGSWEWKREVAVRWLIKNGELCSDRFVSRLVKLPSIDGVDLGFMAIQRDSAGINYIYAECIESVAAPEEGQQ